MARLLLIAASAALLASTSTAAAVLVVRSSGPSAAVYPPGKALPDDHMLKLKATDTVVLLDSRGTRTLNGSVLMKSPTIDSAPANSAGRPATVTPNKTSSSPE